MHWLKRLFDFYIDSSIHVALSVYALVRITLFSFDLHFDIVVSCFAFFGTIVAYNFMKYGSTAKHYIVLESSYKKAIQIFSFCCFAVLLYFTISLNKDTLLIAFLLLLLCVFYIIPFFPGNKNFRNLQGFKIFIVALCWTGTTVFLPLINGASTIFDMNVIFVLLQRFLFVLILMIPFEIYDLKFDEESLGTLPQRIGISKTKILGYSWIILFFVLGVLYKTNVPVLSIISALLFYGILKSGKKKSEYFSSFWIESIPIVWFLLLLLINYL